jgi:hypothetical protein
MNIFSWLWGGEKVKPPTAVEARLPGGRGFEGTLDKDSPTWAFISQWAMSELDKLRASNDNPGKDEVSTGVLRGEIKCLKKLLSLPDRPLKEQRPISDRKGILEDDGDDLY